jgi:hypothetical protein
VPAPDNYTSEVIKVNPDEMFTEMSTALKQIGPLVVDCLNRIVHVWNDLKLGWVGKTSDEVAAFNAEWKSAIIGLFGSGDDHTPGVFGQIGKAVFAAAFNYAGADDGVRKMFSQFLDGLGDHDTPGDGNPDRHRNDPPITENT